MCRLILIIIIIIIINAFIKLAVSHDGLSIKKMVYPVKHKNDKLVLQPYNNNKR